MKKVSALCIILSFVAFKSFSQGSIDGFVRGKGKTDVVVSYTNEHYDQFYLGKDKVDLSATGLKKIIIQSVNLYAVHGISDKLDIILNVPYIAAQSDVIKDGSTVKESNLQNASLFLKWRPIYSEGDNGAFSLILGAGVSTPLSGYKTNVIYAIGNQATSVEGDVLVQYMFKAGFFANIRGGYSLKNNQVPNAALLSAKIGYAGAHFYVDGWIAQQLSNGGIDITDSSFTPDKFPQTQVNTTRLGLSVYIPLVEHVGITFGAGTQLDGRNSGKATALSGGIVFKF